MTVGKGALYLIKGYLFGFSHYVSIRFYYIILVIRVKSRPKKIQGKVVGVLSAYSYSYFVFVFTHCICRLFGEGYPSLSACFILRGVDAFFIILLFFKLY